MNTTKNFDPLVAKQKKNSVVEQIKRDLNAIVRGLVDEDQEGEATVRMSLNFPERPPRWKPV